MKLPDLLTLIVQGFVSRRSRMLFTLVGIAIGIGAILFLVSLGYGLQRVLLERITTDEALLTLDISPFETGGAIELNDDRIAQLGRVPAVERVSPQAIVPGQVKLSGLVSQVTVNSVEPGFFNLAGTTADVGRVFSVSDDRAVVANSTLAELFNVPPRELLGRQIEVVMFVPSSTAIGAEETVELEDSFTVLGVIEASGEPPQVYIKQDSLPVGTVSTYQVAKIKVVDGEAMEQVRNELLQQGFLVSSLSDTIEQANKVFRVVQITLGVFGIVALLVAAIGLINTMTISLLQRTHEIGIMRAIGASPMNILVIFLGESIMIGFLGGMVGILLGITFAELVNWSLNLLAESLGGQPIDLFFYPVWFVAFTILLSTAVGFIAGIFPARRAAKLNALSALRYK